MAEDKCIRCGEGAYKEVDREVDAQDRVFILFECEACKSLVIRREGWDPGAWEKATLEKSA